MRLAEWLGKAETLPQTRRKEKEKENKKMTFCEMYDILRDYVGVSEEAIGLACGLCGQNTHTLENVLFYFTGWHSFEGYMEEIEGK